MKRKWLIDLGPTSNGAGVAAYGGRLAAYAYTDMDAAALMEQFERRVEAAIGRKFFPVYRVADGELRFLFGLRYNARNRFSARALYRYVKYEICGSQWATSWGERYSAERKSLLRARLVEYLKIIARHGCLAIYWNENGLDAFTEYNDCLEGEFSRIGIELSVDNYIPFHVCVGAVARSITRWIQARRVLLVSGMSEAEFASLRAAFLGWGATSVELARCSAGNSLEDDIAHQGDAPPDLVLVAAGIGSAKVINDLRHLDRPVIDIGSYVHVLSGARSECHAGFFVRPDR